MPIIGDGRADIRGDGCVEMQGDGSVEDTLRAGELKRVEGGSDGGGIRDDPEPDGNAPVISVGPDHIVSYGEYRGFFGDLVSACACTRCCIPGGWYGHALRWLMHVKTA